MNGDGVCSSLKTREREKEKRMEGVRKRGQLTWYINGYFFFSSFANISSESAA